MLCFLAWQPFAAVENGAAGLPHPANAIHKSKKVDYFKWHLLNSKMSLKLMKTV